MARRSRTSPAKTALPTPELIVRKRDGKALSPREIAALIDGYVRGEVTDYQMGAMAMAIFFRGLSPEETAALTLAMRDSGSVVNLDHLPGKKVDKHSTGGVGDKVSLCLAPMVAACDVKVPMVSGRGLGHSGGTLDKLEAIPGFSVTQTTATFVKQVGKLGCSLIGQTADIAPADKKLYALRDVTGTVESIPLITASILSKKLAEGIDALVLDVKVGNGAFMKTREDARALAQSIVRVGKLAKKNVTAMLTRMDEPLGFAVGNALETVEAFDVLHGRGPADLTEITYALGAEMLRLAGLAKNDAAARKQLDAVVKSGAAAKRMEEIIRAQKGDPRVVREPDRMPRAPHLVPVHATATGFITAMETREIGLACVALGAGRQKASDVIDPAVGYVLTKKIGDAVKKGDVIGHLHVRSKATAAPIAARITAATVIGKKRTKASPLVLETLRS